jgi:hypothetical protein
MEICMKLRHLFFIILLMIFSLLPPDSLRAANPEIQKIRDAIDVLIAAVSSHSVDPGISTALNTVSDPTRTIITFNAHQKMQTITLEIDDHPEQENELLTLLDKYQAINDAIIGRPARWLKYVAAARKQQPATQTTNNSNMTRNLLQQTRIDDLDNMRFAFSGYERSLDEINDKIELLQKKLDPVQKRLNQVTPDMVNFQRKLAKILTLLSEGKQTCETATNLYQKMVDLKKSIVAGEEIIAGRIDKIRKMLADCTAPGVRNKLRADYQAAVSTLEIMQKALRAMPETELQLKLELARIDKLNKQLKTHNSATFSQEMQNYLDQLDRFKQDRSYLLLDWPKEAKQLESEMTKLKNQIRNDKAYFSPQFPSSSGDFDKYVARVDALRLPYVAASLLNDSIDRSITKFDSTPLTYLSIQNLLKKQSLRIDCQQKDTPVDNLSDKANAAFFRATLAIRDNESCLTACNEPESPLENPVEQNQLPDTRDTETSPALPSVSALPPLDSEIDNGLIIAGPSEVEVGQGLSFIACDAMGSPYQNGDFSWNITREDLMSLTRSGNPAGGAAFKEGTVTIIVHHNGMTAFLDIKIIPRQNLADMQTGTSQPTFNISGVDRDHAETTETPTFNISTIDRNNLRTDQITTNPSTEQPRPDKQICATITGNLRAACRAGNTSAINGLQVEAMNNHCSISTNLQQWANRVVDEQQQRQQRLEEAQRNQQQPQSAQNSSNTASLFDMIESGLQQMSQLQNQPPPGKPSPAVPANPNLNAGANLPVRSWTTPNGTVTDAPSRQNSGGNSTGTTDNRITQQAVSNNRNEIAAPAYCGLWEVQLTIVASHDSRRGYADKVGRKLTRFIDLRPFNRNGRRNIRVTHLYPCNSGKCTMTEFVLPEVKGETFNVNYEETTGNQNLFRKRTYVYKITPRSVSGSITDKDYLKSKILGETTTKVVGVRKLR